MNLGLLMSVGSPSMPTTSSVSLSNGTGSAGFGSVFQSMMATADPSSGQAPLGTDGKLAQLMDGIMNAETLEELAGLLEQLKQGEQKLPAVVLGKSGYRQVLPAKELPENSGKPDQANMVEQFPVSNAAMEEVAELILSAEQSSVFGLAEQAKVSLITPSTTLQEAFVVEDDSRVVSEEKLESLQLTDLPNLQKFPSLQQLVSLISENPDKLIETLTNVLAEAGVTKEQLDQMQATGDIWYVLDVLQTLPPEKLQLAIQQMPEKAIVEMIAMFKTIELAAPKMDLYTKQVELVQSLQPLLAQISTTLEPKLAQPEVKQLITLPASMQYQIRFTGEQAAMDSKQQDQQAKPSETAPVQSIAPQSETRPAFQMTATEKAPESRSEALMREFQAVLNRANFGQTNGMNRLSIKLYPEHLGQIRIELLEVNGVMTARILATTAMAREMLDSQMHQLRQAFNQQNLQVDRIDLTQSLQDPSKSDREQAFAKQNGQQKQENTEQDEQEEGQEMTFEEFMIELEV